MKRMALSVSLILVLAMLAFAGGSNDKGENAVSHQIAGVLEGTFTFVPFPNATSPIIIDSLGDSSGVVKGLGRVNMFTFHRPTPDLSGVMDGLVRIVTSSHDTIQGHYVGTAVWGQEPNQIIGNQDFVITGGTGRFTNASGVSCLYKDCLDIQTVFA